MTKTSKRLVLLVMLAIAHPVAHAAERHLTLTPDDTTISWTLGATGHDVEGAFDLVSGEIFWDPTTGEASGQVEIDATSAKTGNTRRDAKMHDEVLESDKYPRFVFMPVRVQGTVRISGRSRVELHGTLKIHGEERPFMIPADVEASAGTITIASSFQIPFVDWGMKDPSFLFLRVEKTVDVRLRATATVSGGAASDSP